VVWTWAEPTLTTWHIMCHVIDVPSVNIRQLRDTRRLKAWLRAGKTVELRERDKLIARIVPEKEGAKPAVEWPDFAARRKRIFGDRVLPIVDDLINDRSRY
jgi:antitoxin (DNA-binding transcriptional repressor) of toxin-antitoxin stability system